ncbi:YhgE/Pip family protein [Romboutsia sp.]|uniref:YhgE/Pip domain-containing protein n=1 Tax=Romboutsia sp. TaxID=1965302 RepID=UPI003F2E6E65
MKNIFRIYKKDIKGIFTNPVLLIIITGLAILPSLYAWFNIKASWDPYGSTGNISVAVVNADKGANALNKDVNIGKELVDKLKKDKNLGWKFVDLKTARKGVEDGTYYASIEIPKNFSKDLTSLLSSDVKKGEIRYTVNEKINAIAPKITDKGASTVQLEINETVVKTVSETIFEIFNNVGIELENELPKLIKVETTLVEVQNKFKDITNTIDLANDATSQISDIVKEIQGDIPAIKNTLASAKDLSKDVKVFVEGSKDSINQIGPIIKTDLSIVAEISASASKGVENLIDAINQGAEDAPQLVDSLEKKLSSLSSTTEVLIDFLKKIDKFSPGHPLSGVINQLEGINSSLNAAISSLETVKDQIANGQAPSLDKLNKVLKVTNDINSITTNLYNNFDSKIGQPINSIFEKSITVASNVIDVLEKSEAKLPSIEKILNTSLEFSGSAKDTLAFINEQIPKAESMVNELVSTVSKVNNSSEIDELITLLKNDIISQAEFLKQPVDLVTKKLYPVENYGSAMTPFYTILSLWVGVLLLVSVITTEVHGDVKSWQAYFGRGFTFMTIAIVQALIVSIGNILLLKVQVINPVLFVLISVFTSIVFTFIVYSLVSVFGNVGKATAIVLLVIQVGGSGGTFPIQVTPEFFQMVNPLLPFTHAISALRETVAGIYEPNLYKAIVVLIAFLIGSIIINVLLKGPINKATANLRHKFNSSDLVGH